MILGLVKDKYPKDKDGYTPLHKAADEGHVEIIKIILDVVEDKSSSTKSAHHAAHSDPFPVREPAHADRHRGDQGYGLQ